jgi:hypothetical protein
MKTLDHLSTNQNQSFKITHRFTILGPDIIRRRPLTFIVIILTVFFTSLAVRAQSLTNGLVAHYPLDGNADDMSGNDNHGTVTGATLTTDRFGNANGAYAFDGFSDISFANRPPIATNGSFTYSFWMVSTLSEPYPVYSPNAWLWFVDRTSVTDPLLSLGIITENVGTNSVGQFWLMPRFDDYTSPGNNDLGGGIVGGLLIPQAWQHIILARDYGNSFKLYVNGVLVGTATDNGKPLTLPAVTLGRNPNHGQTGLIGKIDDFRIYDRALLDTEIRQLHSGLVAYYPFDGNANDASGNANHGMVNGATLSTDRFGNTNGAYAFNGFSGVSFTNRPPLATNSSFTYTFWMVSTLAGSYPVYPGQSVWFLDRTSVTDPLVSLGILTDNVGTNFTGQFLFLPRYDDYTSPIGNDNPHFGGGGIVGGSLTPQTWQHIAMVRDYGNSFRLFVNGVLVGSAPDNGKPLTPPIVNLGRNPNHGQQGLVGKIDDFRIYDRALTSPDVSKLYREPGLNIAFSQIRLCWDSQPNKAYQIQYQTALTTNQWLNLGGPIPGDGSTKCVTDNIVGPQRFYRVIIVSP